MPSTKFLYKPKFSRAVLACCAAFCCLKSTFTITTAWLTFKLLNKLEDEAKKEGLDSLYTEASLISYELFLKNEWEIIRKEKVIINNIFFERYKMTKIIKIN